MSHLPLDELTLDELKALSRQRGHPAISLYMPMRVAGASTRENHIRFKNHVQEAQRMLEAGDFDHETAGEFLEPAYALIENYDFWQHQAKGLAYFRAYDFEKYYRLPIETAELTVVSERFHLKPILPLLAGNGRFGLLAVSLDRARLFAGNRDDMYEIAFGDDVPTSMAEALRFDQKEGSLQFHSTSSSTLPGRRSAVMYHGTGAGDEDKKMEILRFFRKLDDGVVDKFGRAESEGVPLVFAGVDYLFPLYQEANHYQHLLDEHIDGNPDQMSVQELHEQAWGIAGPRYHEAQEQAAARFYQAAEAGQASTDLREIVPAAADARIDTLFVATDTARWGRFDPDTRRVIVHEHEERGDQDLLDFAAVNAFLNGGKIYAVPPEEVPNGVAAAAVYRF
ncbi:MAG TPA: hypothetical protein VF171_00475 [Trueperaceae bacterium]